MLNVETPLAIDMSVQSHPLCLSTKSSSTKNASSLIDKTKPLSNFQKYSILSDEKNIKTNFQLFPKNLKRKNRENEETCLKVTNSTIN